MYTLSGGLQGKMLCHSDLRAIKITYLNEHITFNNINIHIINAVRYIFLKATVNYHNVILNELKNVIRLFI